MKKAAILSALILISLTFSACGGGSTPSTEPEAPPVSKIAKRVFVMNQFVGKILIVDGATDTLSQFTVPLGLARFTTPEWMVRAGTNTVVFDSTGNTLYAVNSTSESITVGVSLTGPTESIALSADGNLAYAAIPSLGRIDVVDIANNKLVDSITGLPGVRRVVLTKNGGKLLAFANDVNTMVVINTADKTGVLSPIAGFDRPYTAVISSDDTKAFILSCGVECGGTAARVTVLDLATNTPGASVAVGGATVGLLDGSNLYVAGSPAASTATTNGGTFNVVNVGNLAALTASASVPISDGLHHTILAVGGGKFYIGATRCTIVNNGTVNKGCLSIVSGTTAVVGAARGEVTSIAAIKNRTVVYVTQGGDLDIYDTTSDTLQAKQIDISGRVVDAKEID